MQTNMNEPQKVVVIFNVKHSPDSPEHLHVVLRDYLRTKGLILNEDNTIEI